MVRDVAGIFILVVGSMMILSEIGTDLDPLRAAGLSSLAIGFDAQSPVNNVNARFLSYWKALWGWTMSWTWRGGRRG